jgi:hypothetical protein
MSIGMYGYNHRLKVFSDGTVHTVGSLLQNQSDIRLKTNITTIDKPLEKLSLIRGVEFDWIDNIEDLECYPPVKHETGVLAQEIEKAIPDAIHLAPFDLNPDLTSKSGENYLTVQHEKIIPLLIESVKEQQKQIESLTNRISILEQ